MSTKTNVSLDRAIRARAAELGFDQVGFCRAEAPAETAHFTRWLDQGMHAGMRWLERGRAKRLEPRLVLEAARSFVVVTLGYGAPERRAAPASTGADTTPYEAGVVSRYAVGEDYHQVLGSRLGALEDFIESSAPGHRAMAYVDTGPILERLWAARAGIGWVGKNAMILNKEHGS